jgi:hypothetical protein
MNLPWFSSVVASFVRVLGSTVVGEHGAVLLGGEGAVGDADDPLSDGSSDKFTNAEEYCSPAIVWRPRPPEKIDNTEKVLGVEGIGLRLGGSTVPVAVRDLRLNRQFKNPKPGSIALVGYGGGFLAFDDTRSSTSRATLYVPYAYSGGVPTKAMTIAIDPETESMVFTHSSGATLAMLPDREVMVTIDDDNWLQMKPGALTAQFATITLAGTTFLGGPAAVLPVALSSLSPATRVFGL